MACMASNILTRRSNSVHPRSPFQLTMPFRLTVVPSRFYDLAGLRPLSHTVLLRAALSLVRHYGSNTGPVPTLVHVE
jgi:hypothetical protein